MEQVIELPLDVSEISPFSFSLFSLICTHNRCETCVGEMCQPDFFFLIFIFIFFFYERQQIHATMHEFECWHCGFYSLPAASTLFLF